VCWACSLDRIWLQRYMTEILLIDDNLHTFDVGLREEKYEREKVVVVKKLYEGDDGFIDYCWLLRGKREEPMALGKEWMHVETFNRRACVWIDQRRFEDEISRSVAQAVSHRRFRGQAVGISTLMTRGVVYPKTRRLDWNTTTKEISATSQSQTCYKITKGY